MNAPLSSSNLESGLDRNGGSGRQTVIASNRGPVSFVRREEDGQIIARRGTGGLVTALTGALQVTGGMWIASAMTEEDREQTAGGRLEIQADDVQYTLRYLNIDPERYDLFYNQLSNHILWFLHHYLWDISRQPRFGPDTDAAWTAYQEVNETFASALLEESTQFTESPAFLVQDYHLALVPAMLRRLMPEARIAHFSHIPFSGPSYFRILPVRIRRELLRGLLGADVIGFHADAWAQNFLLCCRASLKEVAVDLQKREIESDGRTVRVRVYPISIDAEDLQEESRSRRVARMRRRLSASRGDERVILRVDRTDLSKNILRGFLAYELFLHRHPEWHRRVRFLALLNPSRESIPEYQSYLRQCLRTARRINEGFGDDRWQPIRVSVKDDYPLAVAAYGLYDVLMVNPVFDGMNLVAKEGPLVNQRDGVLILSENAGAFAELGDHAIVVNPFDVGATADALAEALLMEPEERAARARGLRDAILQNRLDRWVGGQLQDLEPEVAAAG